MPAVTGCGLLTRFEAHKISEITLMGGGYQYNGGGGSTTVTLKADGTATRQKVTFAHDTPRDGESQTAERAHIPPEVFARLAAAINDNHFFAKAEKEGMVYDAFQSLTVVYDGGEKTIQTIGRDDPEIKAMLSAFGGTVDQLQWEKIEN